MKHQQGAALVIVMALLSGAMILGLSGMQTALVDERLAGNYRALVQAQMNSDSMVAEFRNYASPAQLDEIYNKDCEEKENCYQEYEDDFLTFLENIEGFESIEKVVDISVNKENGSVTVKTRDQGTNNNADRETVATYRRGSEGSGPGNDDDGESGGTGGAGSSPFESPVVGCEGVQTRGGSTISSYRSSEGSWSGEPGSFSENDIPLIRTTADNADVFLDRSETIHGDIETLGTVTLNGSSQVFGSILANRTISLNGGGVRVRGNAESVSDVIFDSSARVDGIVRAMGEVRLNNWSASVGEGIYAGGDIISNRNPPSSHIDQNNRANFFPSSAVSLNEVESQPCDTVDFAGNSLIEEINRYQEELTTVGNIAVGAYPNVEWRVTPEKLERFDQTWDVNRWVTHASPELNTLFGEQTSFYRVNDLKLTNSPSFKVSGGDVVIVVDGDFTMGGGGDGLVIDKDSSLTVFISGEVDFGSVLKMPESNSINLNGDTTFSLFSGYSSSGTGVNFSSSNRIVANVYAPFTNVSVNSGASFFGSVKGRSVSVSDGSSVVYDELLEDESSDGWGLVGWQ